MPRDITKRRAAGTRSKRVWRTRYPEKALARNAADCKAYYHRNRERINARRRELRKMRECADLLPAPPTKYKPDPKYGYAGTLTPKGF